MISVWYVYPTPSLTPLEPFPYWRNPNLPLKFVSSHPSVLDLAKAIFSEFPNVEGALRVPVNYFLRYRERLLRDLPSNKLQPGRSLGQAYFSEVSGISPLANSWQVERI